MSQLRGVECAAYADDSCLYASYLYGRSIIIDLQLALHQLKIKIMNAKPTLYEYLLLVEEIYFFIHQFNIKLMAPMYNGVMIFSNDVF